MNQKCLQKVWHLWKRQTMRQVSAKTIHSHYIYRLLCSHLPHPIHSHKTIHATVILNKGQTHSKQQQSIWTDGKHKYGKFERNQLMNIHPTPTFQGRVTKSLIRLTPMYKTCYTKQLHNFDTSKTSIPKLPIYLNQSKTLWQNDDKPSFLVYLWPWMKVKVITDLPTSAYTTVFVRKSDHLTEVCKIFSTYGQRVPETMKVTKQTWSPLRAK